MLGATAPPPRPSVGYPPPPPPPPHASSKRHTGLVVGVIAGLMGAVAGYWAMTVLTGGYDFPDQIGGVELTQSGDASDILPWFQGTDVEAEMGVYGSPAAPSYALVVIDVSAETDPQLVWQQVSAQPGFHRVSTGEDIVCGTNPVEPSTGSCMWMEGELLVELDALGMPAGDLDGTAAQVYAATAL